MCLGEKGYVCLLLFVCLPFLDRQRNEEGTSFSEMLACPLYLTGISSESRWSTMTNHEVPVSTVLPPACNSVSIEGLINI